MAIEKYTPGEKVIWQNKVFDFGYYSQSKGKVVIYEEGCKNMQDSYAVPIKDIERAHCKEEEDISAEIINLLERYKNKIANGCGASTHPKLTSWVIYDDHAAREFESMIEKIKNGRKKA